MNFSRGHTGGHEHTYSPTGSSAGVSNAPHYTPSRRVFSGKFEWFLPRNSRHDCTGTRRGVRHSLFYAAQKKSRAPTAQVRPCAATPWSAKVLAATGMSRNLRKPVRFRNKPLFFSMTGDF